MRTASLWLIVLGACASDQLDGAPNPPTLWLAKASTSTMKLVDVEPHPY